MKKLTFIVFMALTTSAFAQDVVKNGTIYKSHPYITKVNTLIALFTKGDTIGMASYYADTVKFIDVSEPKPYGLAQAKAQWKEILTDWSQMTITAEGYPDGLEYSKDPFTVQAWWRITAINKKTQKKAVFEEVVFDTFNKDGKIVSELSYYDTESLMDAMK